MSLEETSTEQLRRAVFAALLRAESDDHVPRTVTALERIATALEKIEHKMLTPSRDELTQRFNETVEDNRKSGQCVSCKREVILLNRNATCYSCFCGDSPK